PTSWPRHETGRPSCGSCGRPQGVPKAGEGPGPELLDAIDALAHADGDVREAQPLEVAQDDGLAVILGQPAERVGQEDSLLPPRGLLARGDLPGEQTTVEDGKRMFHLQSQLPFQADVASPGTAEMPDEIGKVRYQDLPQPGDQLFFRAPAKLGEVAVRLQ